MIPRTAPEEIDAASRSFRSNVLLVTLLNAIPDMVLILDRHRQVVFANNAVTSLAPACSPGSACGMRPGELLGCQEAAGARYGCGTSEACQMCGALRTILSAQSGNPSNNECRILRTGEAGALDLRVWGTPFLWNNHLFTLLVASDIQDEKRRKVLEKIFFHDVLNTASAANSIADLLASGDLELDAAKDDLISSTSGVVAEIRTQRILLDAEKDRLTPAKDEVSALAEISKIVQILKRHPCATGIRIDVSADSLDVDLVTDETLLARILTNMLKNAVEATSPGGHVVTGCRPADDGSGRVAFWTWSAAAIPADYQTQIFRRSFSTKDPSRGLGTYSMKLLAERYLGGKVSFTSTEEHGTQFVLTIPAELPALEERESAEELQQLTVV